MPEPNLEEDHKPYLVGNEIDKKADFSKTIEHICYEFLPEEIDTIIIEEEYQEERIHDYLLAKFGPDYPKPNYHYNFTRRVPDY